MDEKKSTTSVSKDLISALYFDPNYPGSYSGIDSFQRSLKQKGINLNRKQILDTLLNFDTYTLHKPARERFNRNRVIIYGGIDDTWQADLIDIQKFANENNGIKYLLTVIDVFSKYAWVQPLKNKCNKNVIDAFKNIFKLDDRIPNKIQTDQGQEFVGRETQKYLKSKNINFYYVYSENKACVIERFNRTLKERLWRYFTKSGSHNYLSILNNLVSSYNRTYHRSIKIEPINVKKINEDKIFFNLYGFDRSKQQTVNDDIFINIKFKTGDLVRISKYKSIFDKGYTPNWTKEIFIISEIIILNQNPIYTIKDKNGEQIKGSFYDFELQKVYNNQVTYKIEKIIKTRKKNKKDIEFFVKWTGLDNKFNSWIKNIDIK